MTFVCDVMVTFVVHQPDWQNRSQRENKVVFLELRNSRSDSLWLIWRSKTSFFLPQYFHSSWSQRIKKLTKKIKFMFITHSLLLKVKCEVKYSNYWTISENKKDKQNIIFHTLSRSLAKINEESWLIFVLKAAGLTKSISVFSFNLKK